jgi:hypothetical protein
MLREDQQQLVIEADGLLDPLSDPVAGLHVFRGEPAAHASALQVGVEPLGEVLVFTGITQKAGVILDRALRERPGVGDEGIGEAGSTQEDFGQLSVRPFDGIRPDCRRAHVLQRLQSVHGAQIKPTEDRPIDDSSAEGGSAEVGSAEGGFEEVSKAEVGSAEDGSAEVDSTEVGKVEVGSAEIRLELYLLLSPGVPDPQSPSKQVTLLLVGHRAFLLCCALIIAARRATRKQMRLYVWSALRRGRSNTRLLDTTPHAWYVRWQSRRQPLMKEFFTADAQVVHTVGQVIHKLPTRIDEEVTQ